jgi:hypothetical protein
MTIICAEIVSSVAFSILRGTTRHMLRAILEEIEAHRDGVTITHDQLSVF